MNFIQLLKWGKEQVNDNPNTLGSAFLNPKIQSSDRSKELFFWHNISFPLTQIISHLFHVYLDIIFKVRKIHIPKSG